MSDQQFEELVTGLLKDWMASNNGASGASSENDANDVNDEGGTNDEGVNNENNENAINPADSGSTDMQEYVTTSVVESVSTV